MTYISISEMFFYSGILLMIFTGAAALSCAAVFAVTGRKLREQLEKEYGKPER